MMEVNTMSFLLAPVLGYLATGRSLVLLFSSLNSFFYSSLTSGQMRSDHLLKDSPRIFEGSIRMRLLSQPIPLLTIVSLAHLSCSLLLLYKLFDRIAICQRVYLLLRSSTASTVVSTRVESHG